MTSVLLRPTPRTRDILIFVCVISVCLQLAQYCLSETKTHGEISFCIKCDFFSRCKSPGEKSKITIWLMMMNYKIKLFITPDFLLLGLVNVLSQCKNNIISNFLNLILTENSFQKSWNVSVNLQIIFNNIDDSQNVIR